MPLLTQWHGLKRDDKGASVALGNFDGVHLGHQRVIAIASETARRLHAPLGIITFEPHPRQFFAPQSQAFRLMNAEAKANQLTRLGVERIYQLPFDQALVDLAPEAFVKDVLIEGLGVAHVVVGADFRFGKGRAGTANDLEAFGHTYGFGVTIADLIEAEGSEVSSTSIRAALTAGNPREAAKLLGHWHRIEGEVLGGDRRGRELGYPTANMSIGGLHPPCFGIYAVKVQVLTGPHRGDYEGVSSIGVRPMFGVNTPNLETFIFDFSGDLYGEHLSIALVEYLRPEAKFDGLDALIRQMDADSLKAREILAAV
jgi:riboflavin kinase / FMN adenylyltransferase